MAIKVVLRWSYLTYSGCLNKVSQTANLGKMSAKANQGAGEANMAINGFYLCVFYLWKWSVNKA